MVVVCVNPSRSSRQRRVTVLLGPFVEDAGEESRVPKLDLFVVGLDDDLLVKIILNSIAKY